MAARGHETVAERQAALAARVPAWVPRTLHGALDHAVAEGFGDRPFVIADDGTWSYAAIADRSRRIAAGLRAAGVAPGDTVAILLGNGAAFVALKYAIARVGAVAVPINIQNRRDELAYLLAQSDSVVLVTMDAYRGVDYLAALDDIAPGWETRGGGDALPRLRRVVVLATGEGPGRGDAMPFAALERAPDRDVDALAVDPHADCDILYTSGTTGSPKGVLLSHDMLLRTAFGSAWARAFEDGRRILFSLPLYHVFGYVEGLLAVPFVGGAIVPQARFDAHATLAGIERHRATDALLVPAMTLAAIDAARERSYDLTSWRAVLASGGRAPERVWREIGAVLGVGEITTGYGMTETTASTTVTRPGDGIDRLLTTNGRLRDVGPAAGARAGGRLVDYRVVDPDTRADVLAGAVGELIARGPGVTRGYYRKPAETAAAFDAGGWLRTGDLGRIDADGYLTLVGRTKESYRCGGEQVLPAEVEDVLTTHPGVVAAHVVPVPDERMGEVGVAFVVAAPGAAPDAAALTALVAGRLARFKVPRHVLLVAADAIPTTASGRARKFLLADRACDLLGIVRA